MTIALQEYSAKSGVHYTRRGSGRTVVLLHGWCLNGRLWDYAEEHLATRCDTIVPDFAGFGKSSQLAGPFSLERHAEDLRQLLVELDLDDVTLVGFAYGAAVAMTLAAAGNDRVSTLINVGTPSNSASPYDRMPKSMRRDWPDFARRSAKALFHNPQSDATIAWIERMFVSTPLHVAIEAVAELARFDPTTLAASIDVHQVFIHATEDSVAPVALGRHCVERAPDAVIEIIDGCGHLMVIDGKAPFHALLDRYLASAITPSVDLGVPS